MDAGGVQANVSVTDRNLLLAVCLVLYRPDGSYLIRRPHTNKDKVKSEVRAAGGCELLDRGCLGVETRVTSF